MEVQRIKYERSGGFAGMRLSADFQPSDLPDEQSRPLMDLLDEMDFNELPENLTTHPPQPDQFTYKITVETVRGHEHTVVVGDASAPEEMQELLRLLDRIARKRH